MRGLTVAERLDYAAAVIAPAPSDAPGDARRRYLQEAPRVPDQGLDLIEVFPGSAEIEMEIGFGRGGFLIGRGGAAPGASLIGIEIRSKWAFLVAERCRELGLGHVRPMAGDARHSLPSIRPDGAVARVFIHFPDPWWKKRHTKRRVVTPELLVEVHRLLRPGGELFVQTDVPERSEEYASVLSAHGGFEVTNLSENPYGARSNREVRAEEDGLPIHRLLATKRAVTPP